MQKDTRPFHSKEARSDGDPPGVDQPTPLALARLSELTKALEEAAERLLVLFREIGAATASDQLRNDELEREARALMWQVIARLR
jgi:hypothetical protein